MKDDVITSEGASSQVYAQGGLAPLPKGRSRKLHTPPHLSPRLSPYLPIYLPHRPGRQLHAGRPHPVAEALCGRSGILSSVSCPPNSGREDPYCAVFRHTHRPPALMPGSSARRLFAPSAADGADSAPPPPPELPVKLELASGTGDWVAAQAAAN